MFVYIYFCAWFVIFVFENAIYIYLFNFKNVDFSATLDFQTWFIQMCSQMPFLAILI